MTREVARRARPSAWFAPLGLAVVAAGCSLGAPASPIVGAAGGRGADGGPLGNGLCSSLGAVLQGVTALPAGSAPVVRRLWRLSAQQYGNAVRDLLGLPQVPVLSSNGGTSQYAFFSDDSAKVDASFQAAIYDLMQSILAEFGPTLPRLAACATGEMPRACATRFATTFGAKAFRRPLDPNVEVPAILAVYDQGAGDFNTGLSLMLQALLQSPSFLYRTELGPPLAADDSGKYPDTTLTPFEVATQLAFLFTDTIPDDTLTAAAADGSLGTPDGVAKQVDRLLALAPVRQNIDRIVLSWFNVPQLSSKQKDPGYFAGLVAAGLVTADQAQTLVESDLYTSTQMFVDSVLWAPSGRLTDLLTSQTVFVSPLLGQLYGLPANGPADQFVGVTDPNRTGMLTQPAFLWSLSNPTNTSIVKRGYAVHDDVMCLDPGPPAIDFNSIPGVAAALAARPSEIEKSDYRLATEPCKSCHSQVDPYARVLENFGPIGEYRTDRPTVEGGGHVDPTATFSDPLPAGPITGAAAFSQALIDHEILTACAVQKMASYTLGRAIRVRATCEIQALHDQFQQTDGSVSSLFRAVALASFMRARAGGTR